MNDWDSEHSKSNSQYQSQECQINFLTIRVCTENNQHVKIQNDNYMISADGYLMPAKKDQAPPDMKYFNQTRK
jgi:hypothetical protein